MNMTKIGKIEMTKKLKETLNPTFAKALVGNKKEACIAEWAKRACDAVDSGETAMEVEFFASVSGSPQHIFFRLDWFENYSI